ncbi:Xaa-Pro aminopeptidase (EC [Olavius algarvensis Delta 1 endosymbiont]|nr:Xaa-Pro aminopeptidase (EC [Olavius algarvensis Delta 1 endosymbiont]
MRYLPIDSDLFVYNRKRIAERLESNSLAVFNSNDLMPTSADGNHPFIQQTDLFYLSGIDQEESTLVICPDAKDEKYREILFLKETNEKIALWEGHKYTREEAAAASGIKTICWNHEFSSIFQQLALRSENIYLNTNEHLRANARVETRDDRFLNWCRRSFPLHSYRRMAPILHDQRAVKSELELGPIKQACKITDDTFQRLLGFIKPGVWEFEIEAEIHHEFIRNRSKGPAFETIVASGADSCVLHYINNDKQCRAGDLVLIDFGAEYANYAADVTRTVPVSGKFSKRQKQVYNAVLNVQKAAIKLLVPGSSLDDYHKAVGKIMESELIGLGLLDPKLVKKQSDDEPLYKKYYPHGTSHYLGLDVHDYGDRYRPLEPGMVLTCEPGIYIRDEAIGIRIENDILITADGPVDLTANIPREAEEIEALMNQ